MLARQPAPAAPKLTSRRRRPWWIPHFLGGVPDIEPRLLSLLGMVSLALFFEQYDISMLTAALKFIAEDLGMPESALGGYTSAIRIGSLPALLVIPFADRIGRRRLFLASVLGISVSTCATAFTQTPAQFVSCQIVTRIFLITGSAVAIVIVTEEFPAEHRGWGIGMVGALAACGNGFGAILFAVIDKLPFGWRALYAIGLVPLALLPMFRRRIRETGRFEAHHSRRLAAGDDDTRVGWWRPLFDLARTHPLRAGGLALVGGLASLGTISVFQFIGYFTLTVHHWQPWEFSAMLFFGGGIGIIGNVVSGRLGDRIGRRRIGLAFLGSFPLFAWIFYRGPGWSLPLAWVMIVFCATAGTVVVRALSTELFPTSHRGTSAGWMSVVDTLGGAAGLALVGWGTRAPGDLARMTSLMSLFVLAGGLFLLVLPETNRRELEEINPE
jgi:AAHS family 4-hydroxybenzoate transporter-like MFS transporter